MTVSLGILPAQIASSQHKTVQDVSGASQGILFVRFESLRVPVDVEKHIRFRSTKTRFDSERSDKNETAFCENENNRMMLYLALDSELPRPTVIQITAGDFFHALISEGHKVV